MTRRQLITVLLLALPGIVLGLSGYTFYYAKGYSYLLDNPDACVNCHVMRENYNAWQVSPHRFVTCNGCHVPHNFLGKYATKVEHGMRHSYVFTFENPQVIRIKESGKDIVESNCVRCHAMMVSTIVHGDVTSLNPTLHGGIKERRCFECHQGMGHAE